MNKLLAWILGKTKVGTIIDKSRELLAGKKTYIAGAALAVPALITVIQNFSDQGAGYLLGITATPEYQHLLEGIGFITGRAAIGKLGK